MHTVRMRIERLRSWLFLTPLVGFLTTAAGHSFAADITDISGLAAMPGNSLETQRFLVVNDKKDRNRPGDRGARVGVLTIHDDEGQSYVDVEIPVAEWGARQANDLEAACSIPGAPDCYLLLESSYYKGNYGRIFMIKITRNNDSTYRGQVQKTYRLPPPENDHPFNLEGLACFMWRGGLHLLLGDRANYSSTGGDTRTSSHGTLFHALLPQDSLDIEWTKIAEVVAPTFVGERGTGYRHCSALFLQPVSGPVEGYTVWIGASHDPDSKTGPFYSEVYAAGVIDLSAQSEKELFSQPPQPPPGWTCDGVKIEALAKCESKNATMCIGTDDENLGGAWRSLQAKPGP